MRPDVDEAELYADDPVPREGQGDVGVVQEDSEAGSDTFEDVDVQTDALDGSASDEPSRVPPSPPALSSIRARIQALNASGSPSKQLQAQAPAPPASVDASALSATGRIDDSPIDVATLALTDVPLDAASPASSPVASKDKAAYTLSPPRPIQLSDILPSPLATPPEPDPLPAGPSRSLFPTLGFGTAQRAPPRALATPAPADTPSSTTSNTSWRSSFANLLGPTPPKPPLDRTPSASTAMLLNKLDSTASQQDRRRSRQAGGESSIQHGFRRLKAEMEGTAREMRRERDGTIETDAVVEGGVDWAFWGAVVQDYDEMARTRPKDLSRAIQQGIPAVIRGHIWQLMSASKSAELEAVYKDLLKQTSPHEKSIQKDLNRTFPNHEFFQQGGGVGQEALFMVVKAYSLYDHDVGYTQGLAFIVAALLLNMPDEEAFCVLVRLMESYDLRSHFLADMPGLQLRLFQFDRLVEDILPLVHVHFMRSGVKSSMFASQWFMTMFSYRFPLSLVYRVLDIVFAEGIEAIFRFSLALLKKSEDELCALDFEAILQYLQSSLFERYKQDPADRDESDPDHLGEGEWKANEFVRDAYEVRITPFMLDSYAAEWHEQCKAQNRHAEQVDNLRNANRNLSFQVKSLEHSLATMNQEHVELVRQLVMSKIEKEEIENELVRYKILYAELAHAQQDALSSHSRLAGPEPSRSSTH